MQEFSDIKHGTKEMIPIAENLDMIIVANISINGNKGSTIFLHEFF